MKLIIGLGNPGKEYEHTRHNVGFLAVDFLQHAWRSSAFHADKKMSAQVSEAQVGQEKILLVKPETFMNASGNAVSLLMHFYKITPKDMLVIHDDLDIAPGTYKVTTSSRAAGHHGVEDIIHKLGTQDFWRIRIGIGRPPQEQGACLPGHVFVLQKFSPQEFATLAALYPEIERCAMDFVTAAGPRESQASQ